MSNQEEKVVNINELKQLELLYAIKDASQNLIIKLIEIEQDPGFRSVFAVSSIHGFTYKGSLWGDKSQHLAKLLNEYNKPEIEAAKLAEEKAKAEQP